MRALLVTWVCILLATVRAQVVISPGAGTYGGAYGGMGYAVGAVVPGVNVVNDGTGGFFNGGFGLQAGGARGIYGVTRRTFMGDANLVAARYFASGGLRLPVQPANGLWGQQGYAFVGGRQMQQSYANRLPARAPAQRAVALDRHNQNVVTDNRNKSTSMMSNRPAPRSSFVANSTTATTSFPSMFGGTNGFSPSFSAAPLTPANK